MNAASETRIENAVRSLIYGGDAYGISDESLCKSLDITEQQLGTATNALSYVGLITRNTGGRWIPVKRYNEYEG